MARAKHQNKHLWKHHESGTWYYQRTYKGKRYKFSLETNDINQARILRNKYDLMLAVDGTITRNYDEYIDIPVFGQVCLDWLKEKKKTCRHDTIVDGYKPKLNAHLLKAPFVDSPINVIEPIDIEKWWHTLADTLQKSTINIILTIMSNIFKYAEKNKWINSNPVKTIERPKNGTFRPDPFELDGVEIILHTIDPFYHDYQETWFFGGFRSSEINAFEPYHFVPKNKIVKVRQSVVNGRFNEPKNESSNRDVKLNDRAYQAFKRQLKRAKKQGSKTLFFNKHGDPIDSKTYIRVVWRPLFEKKEMKDAKIRYRHSRCSRHTYISLALDAGEKPMFVAIQVGHSNARTLFEHYAGYIKDDHDGSKIDAKLTQSLHNYYNQTDADSLNTPRSF
jgi:integrase